MLQGTLMIGGTVAHGVGPLPPPNKHPGLSLVPPSQALPGASPELVTLSVTVSRTENGLPRLEFIAPDDPVAEQAFERMCTSLRGAHAAHEYYRRSRKHGGRIDRFFVVCLPERRRHPRRQTP
jgi:hypothetical protein